MKYLRLFENIDFEEDWEEFSMEEKDEYDVIKNINKDFYDFLIKEGIIDQYIENIKNGSYVRTNDRKLYRDVSDFLNNHHIDGYIDAFIWDETEEGYDFWDNIYYRWAKHSGFFRN